ncbi:MAG TPA: PIN domain-containing protein [Trebonia sp.]|nr:PIN domain-containing protein [Trebonia sp.]
MKKTSGMPWASVVLDSQGLWSVAQNDDGKIKALLDESSRAGVPVLVSAAVLAETLFGDKRDARVNQVLKKVEVVPVTGVIARSAVKLKRDAGAAGVSATIDAVVVATSEAAGGGVILTSDPKDIRALADCVAGRRIRPVLVS